jgi:hypothetical protein
MGIKRIGTHLLLGRRQVRKAFPRESLARIEKAIAASEKLHTGQIRFVVEGALEGRPLLGISPRGRVRSMCSLICGYGTPRTTMAC